MKYLIVVCGLLICCKPAVDSMEQKRAQVMKIHDEAMARMGDIQNSTIALEEISPVDSDSTNINLAIKKLQDAEEGMMVWMEKYKEPEENLALFYESEMIKIQNVADEINKSLVDAKKYINK